MWNDVVAAHTHVKGTFTTKVKSQLHSLHMSVGRRAPQQGTVLTITRFVKTVVGVAVGGKDRNLMASILQPHCSIDDKPLSSSNS